MQENRHGQKWSEEETILAFYLYCQIPFSKISKTNPEIIRLANILGRTADSVSMKLFNLAHFDPNLQKRNVKGMGHASQLDGEIAQRFLHNWEELTFSAKQIEAGFLGANLEESVSPTAVDLPEGSMVPQTVQARVNQQFFRNAVLSSYKHSCCITGITIPSLLIASHIKPWSKSDPRTERTNPCNGLCLNALHDKAFDQGLITVLPDCTVRVSSKLLKHTGIDDSGIQWLLQCNKQEIRKPDRFPPAKEFLEYHNDMIFQSEGDNDGVEKRSDK